MDTGRVVIAEILRPRGNRGELLARSQTDVPGRFENLRTARARLRNGTDVPVEFTHVWPHKENWVLKLAGVDSISAAEQFRGADLWVPFGERARLPEGEFFQTDLIGCAVVDRNRGKQLGRLDAWQQYGGPPLMELSMNGKQVLIPFVSAMCNVDLEARAITVDLPEGLLDL
ncbi:MAG: 16S rRNA processing protein RimM [Acidobacteriaceae bacterium]|nr:16S rRNA processing protein RimM [Acidobacteriaceae bacterium]